jgi:cytochrome c biogenesis protein CcdA
MAHDGGIRQSWKIILPLSLGRMTAYGTFGLLVGLAGHYVNNTLSDSSIRGMIGCAVLMMGFALLLGKTGPCGISWGKARMGQCKNTTENHRVLLPGGLFLMGVSMALSPCVPLGIVLFSAGASGSAAGGLLLGVSFGLGAITVPALFYGIAMAYMGTRLRNELQNWRPLIERISALLLIAVGVSNLVS